MMMMIYDLREQYDSIANFYGLRQAIYRLWVGRDSVAESSHCNSGRENITFVDEVT